MANIFSGLSKGIQRAQESQFLREGKEERDKIAKLQGQLLELQLKQVTQKQGVVEKLQAPTTQGVPPQELIGQLEQNIQSGQIEQIGRPSTSQDLPSRMAQLSIGDRFSLMGDKAFEPQGFSFEQVQQLMKGGGGAGGLSLENLRVGPSGKPSFEFKTPRKTDEQLNAATLGLSGKEKNKFIRDALKMGVSDDQLRQIEINRGILNNQQTILEIRKLVAETKTEKQTKTTEIEKFQKTVNNDVDAVFEMAELLDAIEDTAVKTGAADRLRLRGMSVLALVNGGDADLVSKAERFDNLSSQFGISLALQMFKGQRMTQTEFEAVRKSILGSSTQADANRLGMADIVRRILDEENSNPNVSLKDRKKLMELEARLRGGGKTGGFGPIPAGATLNFDAQGKEI